MTHGTATLKDNLLTLTIKGKQTIYAVAKIETDRDVAHPAYSLQKVDVVTLPAFMSAEALDSGATAELQPVGEPYHVAVEPHGYSCSCADFTYRNSNNKEACKHARSLIAVGLLPKIYRSEDEQGTT